jgi:hypothetical protein
LSTRTDRGPVGVLGHPLSSPSKVHQVPLQRAQMHPPGGCSKAEALSENPRGAAGRRCGFPFFKVPSRREAWHQPVPPPRRSIAAFYRRPLCEFGHSSFCGPCSVAPAERASLVLPELTRLRTARALVRPANHPRHLALRSGRPRRPAIASTKRAGFSLHRQERRALRLHRTEQ